MENLLALPISIHFIAAALILLVPGAAVRKWLSVAACGVVLVVALLIWLLERQHGILAMGVGGWPAPFGIALVADRFAGLMLVISATVGLTGAIYGLSDVGAGQRSNRFDFFFQVLLGGVNGAFLSGDLFNIFVWFEVMLMASFVLVSSGGQRNQLAGGIKYMALNFIASGLFLTALGLLYGKTGTLNLADLAVKLANPTERGLLLPVGVLLFAAFGIKAGLFPLYSWLPASYHTPLPVVSAVFAGLLTKVGVYSLIRLFTLVFPLAQEDGGGAFLRMALLVTSLATMVFGVFGAATQMDARRILSFHIISQIGYMTAGLAIGGTAGLTAAVFYTIHHIAVKTNLFFVAGTIEHLRGTGALGRLGGLWRTAPWLCVLFLIPALSLAGIPPLSGFWAKLLVLKAAIGAGWFVTSAIALAVGVFTLYSMTKIWNEAFWKSPPEPVSSERQLSVSLYIPGALLCAVTLIFSLMPETLLSEASAAAAQLADPSAYIKAVLGGAR